MCGIKHCGNNFHIEKKCKIGFLHVHKELWERIAAWCVPAVLGYEHVCQYTCTHTHTLIYVCMCVCLCMFDGISFHVKVAPCCFILHFFIAAEMPNVGANAMNCRVQCFSTAFWSSNGGWETADNPVADIALLPASALNPLLRGV